MEARAEELIEKWLGDVVQSGDDSTTDKISAITELKSYLMGSWGSAQRLDYGTGHELGFLAFLGGLWKLGAFQEENQEEKKGSEDGQVEREVVLGVIEP